MTILDRLNEICEEAEEMKEEEEEKYQEEIPQETPLEREENEIIEKFKNLNNEFVEEK